LQNQIRDKIRDFTGLGEGDVDSQPMGCSGLDIRLSPLAQRKFPWAVECKNQESWNLGNYWKQTLSNSNEDLKPLLFIKKNHHETLAVLRESDFFELLDQISELSVSIIQNLQWELEIANREIVRLRASFDEIEQHR
jgi:hypothetical protein